jgi:hypothetical protein
MDRETAAEFVKRIELAFAHLDESLEFLRPRLDDADLRAFGGLWGQIVSELDLGVLEVIYRAHPDLRPEGMTPVIPLGVGGGSGEDGG